MPYGHIDRSARQTTVFFSVIRASNQSMGTVISPMRQMQTAKHKITETIAGKHIRGENGVAKEMCRVIFPVEFSVFFFHFHSVFLFHHRASNATPIAITHATINELIVKHKPRN